MKMVWRCAENWQMPLAESLLLPDLWSNRDLVPRTGFVLYFFFQLASVSVMYQHVEAVTDVKQINRAAIGIFLCNFLTMEISVVGLLTVVFAADLATATVPMLTLVQHGVGTKMMTVVKKGYAYLGYAALITLFIPFVIHAIGTKGKEI